MGHENEVSQQKVPHVTSRWCHSLKISLIPLHKGFSNRNPRCVPAGSQCRTDGRTCRWQRGRWTPPGCGAVRMKAGETRSAPSNRSQESFSNSFKQLPWNWFCCVCLCVYLAGTQSHFGVGGLAELGELGKNGHELIGQRGVPPTQLILETNRVR